MRIIRSMGWVDGHRIRYTVLAYAALTLLGFAANTVLRAVNVSPSRSLLVAIGIVSVVVVVSLRPWRT